MTSSISVHIPDCKLGTVRVDRTVDIYPTPIINDESIFHVKSYVPKLILKQQLTEVPGELFIEDCSDERQYAPKTKWNYQSRSADEDESDIAVIYSLVRCATTRRTSVPYLSVLPLATNVNIPRPCAARTYTSEPPLTPIVTHVSKQAEIKTLTSTRTITTITTPVTTATQLSPPTRIQTSTSFTSHDRPSAPLIAIKPRPYSFRSSGRNVFERQISHITERVTQLHETFFSRLSHSHLPHQPRNRSLSTSHPPITDLNSDESDLIEKHLVRPRPKSETYEDHHRVQTAGPYAQLTLLGQPRANPAFQTQKSVSSSETQNERVQFRTQISTPERSSSTLFDAKKARDAYDKIFKQFETARKELDRQRAKGSNHNTARITQLEKQLRQFEQQLNEIKRRLESIEPNCDSSQTKHDDNQVNRTNTFIESSTNRSNTNTDTLNNIPAEEVFKFRELIENEDENNHANQSNVQSISTFDDLQLLINTTNWIPITIFLNFLLTDTNSDPSHLLFYLITEELRSKKAENRAELVRWAFEIHSTFTMYSSPLYIGLPQSQMDAINRSLMVHQIDMNEDMKIVFNDARDHAKSAISNRQLPDFNQKRTVTANNDLTSKQTHFVDERLRSIFEQHYKSVSTEDWNSTKNNRSLALLCSLATYLKRCDIKKCGNIPLEKIPKFLDREPKRLLAKLQRATPMKKIKEHQFNEHQFTTETLCQFCYKPLWGINYQGYLCGYCQQAYHRECVLNSEKCSKDRVKFRKMPSNRNPPSPSRTESVIDGRESSVPNEINENTPGSTDGTDPEGNAAANDQNKNPTVGRCSSDRRAAPDRPAAPKNRSSSNPQMGGNTIDELLNHHNDNELANQQDPMYQQATSSELLTQQAADGDSDLEADVNTLPNLSEVIPADVLQILYQTREWKFQTTINELIHTQRTHLKSLKIMKKCFREPMERFPGMSPVELDCIFRNLDQLIHLHTQFKYALRQHREDAKDHVVRNISDVILKFLDGENGEEFARACAYFIEDQSQAIKLIKKKEQSPDFAALMRTCESNPLCRRLTLKDYLPSVMTRFTKYKMLFEAMQKFVTEDPMESEKLTRCIECADYILKRMNEARLKKEQEALLRQIKSNLDIQIPNDAKVQNLKDCLEVSNDRLIYSGTLKLLPDLTTQKTEFECCLFTDIFVFFQKIPIQPSEQRGIEESYKYVLKEHQRDANSGRTQRSRPLGSTTKFTTGQNFILTPIIRLEHLLIKKKACGGARSFYVIDTDKKQLIEVEANSKDDLEKWLGWIEKARKSLDKPKPFLSSLDEKILRSSSSTSTIRSTIIEEDPNNQLLESNDKDTLQSITESILPIDKELKRLLYEKQMLLARLLNIPQDTTNAPTYSLKPNSSLEAISYANSYYNQLLQVITQPQNETTGTVDIHSISTVLIQLGDQLSLALKLINQSFKHKDNENLLLRRNSTSFTVTPSLNGEQNPSYSDMPISSLHSSQSLSSVITPFQQQSSITDLDEGVKTTPLKQLHVAREIVERYDEGVFDDGAGSQTEDENNSVVIADSDDEDEVEHFDTTDVDGHQRHMNENSLQDTQTHPTGDKNSNVFDEDNLKANEPASEA
ncbi:unnamed protein product [Adineta ricciae]|uniref:Uncharacterized protein n=1 Tax=Adineta ricciae TaxID=249248 RepID=A0A813W6G6_ADIRI|nr:unnamed protein product [Adineta ricciae]